MMRSRLFAFFLSAAFAGSAWAAGSKSGPALVQPVSGKPLFIAHYMTWFGLPERSGDWFQWKFSLPSVGINNHHNKRVCV
jgi:hypothetical protein